MEWESQFEFKSSWLKWRGGKGSNPVIEADTIEDAIKELYGHPAYPADKAFPQRIRQVGKKKWHYLPACPKIILSYEIINRY